MEKLLKHKRNPISFCPILGPRLTLGTVCSGKIFVRLGYFLRLQG